MTNFASPDDHKNPGIKRPYFSLPDILDDIDNWCEVKLCIPDDVGYRQLLSDVLAMLSFWYNYKRTGDNSGKRVADVWRSIKDSTNLLGSCADCAQDDCGCENCHEQCEDDCEDC